MTSPTETGWRQGRSQPINLYRDGRYVAVAFAGEDLAADMARMLNEHPEQAATIDTLRTLLEELDAAVAADYENAAEETRAAYHRGTRTAAEALDTARRELDDARAETQRLTTRVDDLLAIHAADPYTTIAAQSAAIATQAREIRRLRTELTAATTTKAGSGS